MPSDPEIHNHTNQMELETIIQEGMDFSVTDTRDQQDQVEEERQELTMKKMTVEEVLTVTTMIDKGRDNLRLPILLFQEEGETTSGHQEAR